jgi:hypothetical protein
MLSDVELDLSKEKEQSRQMMRDLTDVKNLLQTKTSEATALHAQLLTAQVLQTHLISVFMQSLFHRMR